MMQCPKCQHQNQEEDKFCRECGTKLSSVCPQCGREVNPQDKFCPECGTRLGEATSTTTEVTVPKLEDMHTQLKSLIPSALAQKYLDAEQEAMGENRLITALFADISGSTGLAATRSTELMFQLIQDCFKELVNIVAGYEGSISGFRGDGLLALFGAPILHENDAERAILAAIKMRDAMHKQELDITVGVNTALMTVGEIKTQLHAEYTAYSTEIVLARRLQENANRGQIFVGTGTYRQTHRAFDFRPLENLKLKGFDERIVAYEVLNPKVHPEKVRGIEGLRARMIGREREFGDLKDAADLWFSGQGQVVSIVGEAGIGKSRLVEELRLQLPAEMVLLEGRSISIGQTISYWPFIDLLRTHFGLHENDSEAEIARKVTDSVTELLHQNANEFLPFIGRLLSIRFGNELDKRLDFAAPDQIRHQTLMRLKDYFEALSKHQPLLLILEDLHWTDDLSLDLTSALLDSLATTPLMLLCVYRPEQEHRVWQLADMAQRKCLDRFTAIRLQQLSSQQSRLLVEELLTIDNLPTSVKEMILSKSEGNPFFIEEVIRSLIDRDLVYREGNRWKARAEVSELDVPDTIQSVVLARVDRLQAEAKQVLQCAAVIGRLFKYRLLEQLTQREHELNQHLDEIKSRDLVYEERTVPELEYAFKHAFTQEATYQGILQQRRKQFHHQVAQGIERLYQERLEEYYEELAHHYSRSDDTEKAVEYLLKAGEKAKASYANEAAIAHFQRALELLEQSEITRKDWKLCALCGLGEVYFGIGKVVEAEKAFEEAIVLAKEMELPSRQLVRLYDWLAETLYWQSRYDEVIRYGEMGLEILADDTECAETVLMNAKIAIGNAYSSSGSDKKWVEYTHKNMAFINKLEYSVEFRGPYHHIVCVVAWRDRDLEAAWECSKEFEARAQQYHDLTGLADVWKLQGDILRSKGDQNSALSLYQKALDMFERIGDNKHASWCHRDVAGILFKSGNIDEAGSHTRVGVRIAEQIENPEDIANAHRELGDIALCQHRWEEVFSHYQKNLELRQAIKNPFWIVEAYLLLGIAYLKKGDCCQAIQFFQETADGAVKYRRGLLSDALGGMEEAYMALGTPEKHVLERSEGFIEFCRSFQERHADALKKLPLRQWYLELAEPSTEFPKLDFADDFQTETIEPSWSWIDEFGDCAVRNRVFPKNSVSLENLPSHGLELCAANGRDLDGLNLSTPRLMREISGDFDTPAATQSKDFAVEVCVSSAFDEKPQMGGLLVWKDRDNFLRFEKGVHGQDEVRLHGYVDGKYQVAGRGLLCRGSASVPARDEESYLRLEREGEQFSAYCSVDAKIESWATCGKLTLPLKDPIQVGIHAIGTIDRTIYCGAYKEGTATVFRDFKLWTR